MKNINWLKIMSYFGMGLGFIGSILSDYANQEQTKLDIKEQVEAQVKAYLVDEA